MDQQEQYSRAKKKSLTSNTECNLLDNVVDEIRLLFGKTAGEENRNEWVYVLESYFFDFIVKPFIYIFVMGRLMITICNL